MQMTTTGRLPRAQALFAMLALAVGVSMLIGSNLPAHAANGVNITVNTAADPAGPGCTGGTCSVRQAITVANGDTNDIIHLPEIPAGSATVYHTTQGALAISAPMTIAGDDPRLVAVDGENAHSVFSIGTAGQTVIITGITVQHGSTNFGAGINNRSTVLNLGNDIIANNLADDENGGRGAGVYNLAGTLTVVSTTFSNNITVQAGNPGIGQGGGIYNANQAPASLLTLTNDTFNGNSSGEGGAVWTSNPANLNNDTIVGNTAVNPVGVAGVTGGGGIFDSSNNASAKVTLHNTIVSKNLNSGDCGPDNTHYVSTGHNIDGDNSCNLTGAGDQPSTDPQVSALAFNAPPVIPPNGFPNTMAIGPGSPALDKADNTNCPTADERGANRPQNVVCDIGAFEFVPAAAAAAVPALPKAGLAASSPAPAPGWAGFALLIVAVGGGLLIVGRRTAQP